MTTLQLNINSLDTVYSCIHCIASTLNQAPREYKHSLTFRVRRYVVVTTKPVHRLQIRPIVHNHSPKLYVGVCSSVSMRRQTDTQTDTYTETQTQTCVTNMHFAFSTTHAKCNRTNVAQKMIQLNV